MSHLLVVTGLEFEARRLARRLRLRPRQPAALAPAWIGPTKDSPRIHLTIVPHVQAPRLAPADRPREVLGVGLAGGLAPDLEPGGLVVGEHVLGPDGGSWHSDLGLARAAVKHLSRLGLPYRVGTIVTCHDLVSTPEAKAALWRETGALATDLESARILELGRAEGVPALVVRAVADGPSMALDPAWTSVLTGRGGVDPRALLKTLICRPRLGVEGARLAWVSRLALSRLARFLVAFGGEETF